MHARRTITYSKRPEDLQRLLDVGVGADPGERWNAIVTAAVALTATPIACEAAHVTHLRAAKLDDAEIADVINSPAFFNWASRLMLLPGELAPIGQ